ncbi:hypothetical protein BKA93DRAFT_457492 [Sparassis latifolia]
MTDLSPRGALSDAELFLRPPFTLPRKRLQTAPTYPTPLKSDVLGGLQGRSKHESVDTVVRAYVGRNLAHNIERDVPVLDFVRAVWNFTRDQIPTPNGLYTLSRKLCKSYCDCSSERQSYKDLNDIFHDIITQMFCKGGRTTHVRSFPVRSMLNS